CENHVAPLERRLRDREGKRSAWCSTGTGTGISTRRIQIDDVVLRSASAVLATPARRALRVELARAARVRLAHRLLRAAVSRRHALDARTARGVADIRVREPRAL